MVRSLNTNKFRGWIRFSRNAGKSIIERCYFVLSHKQDNPMFNVPYQSGLVEVNLKGYAIIPLDALKYPVEDIIKEGYTDAENYKTSCVQYKNP